MQSIAKLTPRLRAFLAEAQAAADEMNNRMFAAMYYRAVEDKVLRKDGVLFEFLAQFERTPVDIETFIDSEEFLGATDINIWPEVRQTLIEINREWWTGIDRKRGGKAYNGATLMGATGTAKSTISMISTMYHTYLLSCMKNPQAWYGLPKNTSIVFAIMAAKPHVMKKVIYVPMRKYITQMPYFQKHMMPDKTIESEMLFIEKNIRIVPAGGDEDAILGEAIVGGIVDEINFMNVVLRSKKAEVTSGRAGMYDQAEQVHSTMVRRKRGRFTRSGPMIGIVFASSSTRYKGDFTDKQKAMVDNGTLKSEYVYNRRQFDVVPKERFTTGTFRFMIGNGQQHECRVLRDDETSPEGAWIIEIPREYLDDFIKKPYDAMRDVLGISNNALSPFIKMRHKVSDCIEDGKEYGLTSFLLRDHVILGEHGMPQIKSDHYCMNPSRPRYVHIDLSRNGDRCGIAMVRFEGMREVARSNGVRELLPVGVVEMACTITPDANNEIDVAEVRAFVKHLKDKYGYPIKAVTYDNVDSRESIQQWRKSGMRAGQLSVDRGDAHYKQFRDAMYDQRVYLPDDELLTTEILELEYDEDKNKIDHPVKGTKDCADAVCGAYCSMLERRSTWSAAAGDDHVHAVSQRRTFDDRFDEPRRD